MNWSEPAISLGALHRDGVRQLTGRSILQHGLTLAAARSGLSATFLVENQQGTPACPSSPLRLLRPSKVMEIKAFWRFRVRKSVAAMALCLALVVAGIPPAQSAPNPAPSAGDDPRIVVTGRRADLIGLAGSASQGEVSADDLALRPVLRPGEIVEQIPGSSSPRMRMVGRPTSISCVGSIPITASISRSASNPQ